MSPKIKHYINPLHLWCRMLDCKIFGRKLSTKICKLYEKKIFKKYIIKNIQE
jgi:hypothetical protein